MTSKYFTNKELACRCGCGAMPKQETIDLADRVREAYGRPLNCNSGARCVAYTEKLRAIGVPAAKRSAHIDGLAVDLAPVDKDYAEFHEFCIKHLEDWDCYMENPADTPLWSHLQTRPTTLKRRIFRP